MRKRRTTRDALVITSVAAGFFLGSPLAADAAEEQVLDPTAINLNEFDINQTLRYGHTGYSVRLLQFELKKRNLFYDTIDGYYGSITAEAVRKFQALYGLHVDGIVGQDTLVKLNEIMKKPKPKDLSLGDEGPEVEQLQTKLQKLSYYTGSIDGVFGTVTESSLKAYQTKYKLLVNGIATEETIDHIMQNKNMKGKTIITRKVKTESSYTVDTGIISIAMNYLGTPYVWGGNSPSGFDCSGFLKYVFSKKGVNIPRTVSDIWNSGSDVQKLSVGDLVFFQTYKPGPSHAGIYIGDGKFIHTSSSEGVTITPLSMSYWKQRYLGAKRIVQFR